MWQEGWATEDVGGGRERLRRKKYRTNVNVRITVAAAQCAALDDMHSACRLVRVESCHSVMFWYKYIQKKLECDNL